MIIRHWLGRAPVIGCGLALAACSADAGTGDGTVFRDSAGVAIAESDHTRPAWGDDGWRLSDTPLIEVGSLDAEGPEQFLGVMDARLLPNGNLAVVNARLQRVVLFDAQGQHLRTIGRSGDGPGEFRSPWQVHPLAGDSLMVVDIYRMVSVFDAAGAYIRRFVPGEIVGETQGAPIGQFGDGSLFLMQYQHGSNEGRTGLGKSQVEPVRVGLDGTILERFGLFDEQVVNFGAPAPHLFGAWGKFRPDGEAFWYAWGERFEARRIERDGRVTRLVRLDLPRRPVTQADKDGVLEGWRARVRGTPQEPAITAYISRATFEEVLPALDNLLVDDEGNLWIEDYRVWSHRAPPTWRVFDAEGRYLGPVAMPAGFQPLQVTGGKVVGRWTDESDVEFVRVYGVGK
jgi:hypothetical protein